MVQVISSMVDIRTSCYAARLAAFSCPQKHWKALIFRGALMHKLAATGGLIDRQRSLKVARWLGIQKGQLPKAQGQLCSGSWKRCQISDQGLSVLGTALGLRLMRFLSLRLKLKAAAAPRAGRGPGAGVDGGAERVTTLKIVVLRVPVKGEVE